MSIKKLSILTLAIIALAACNKGQDANKAFEEDVSTAKAAFFQTGGAWVDEDQFQISQNCGEIVAQSTADAFNFMSHTPDSSSLRMRVGRKSENWLNRENNPAIDQANKELDSVKASNKASSTFDGNNIVETVSVSNGTIVTNKYRYLPNENVLEQYDMDVEGCEKHLTCRNFKEGKTERMKYCKGDLES
jgi:hypothetical protein